MTSRQPPNLIEVLNDCADRLARGQTVEDCLRLYPHYADQLRALLPLANLPARARASRAETNAAYHRVGARVDALLEDFTVPRRPTLFYPLRAAALLILVGGLLFLLFGVPPPQPPVLNEIPLTTTLPAAQTATPDASVTPTATNTQTPAPPMQPTASVSPTPSCTINPPTDWVQYRVQTGDTLSALAALGGVSVEELLRVNCLTDERMLVAGQRLYLPVAPQKPEHIRDDDDDDDDPEDALEDRDDDDDHHEDDDHHKDDAWDDDDSDD